MGVSTISMSLTVAKSSSAQLKWQIYIRKSTIALNKSSGSTEEQDATNKTLIESLATPFVPMTRFGLGMQRIFNLITVAIIDSQININETFCYRLMH
jgi:hypothetical protein